MKPETVGALLDKCAALFDVAADVEVTLEANPTSVEAARFHGFRAAGVNRLSLGVQALSDEALRFLGRQHSAAEALAALALAQETFPRVSFDLIYARPDQTEEAWRAELARALALGTEHLSLYQLTFEAGTPFGMAHARGKMPGLEEDAQAVLYETTQELCEDAGRPAYEISNHARPGAECRHNLLYWRYGEYLGIGPGAHGRIGGHATAAIRAPEAWAQAVEREGHGLAEDTALSPDDQGTEYLLMALRLAEGADLARYKALAGAPLDERRIRNLAEEELLTRTGERIAATPRGRLVLNRIIEALAV
jgi:oxygen-independent coproporphyrinogen-3 oxidase